MPQEITNIANTTISTLYVVGGLFALVSVIATIVTSYIFYIVKAFSKKFEEIKESLKVDDEKMDKILEKANSNAERIARVEGKTNGTDQAKIKQADNNI